MEFEWDPAKSSANLEKHGVDFSAAVTVFDGFVHEERSDRGGEERWLAVGMLKERLTAVIYTRRAGRTRIISARRARQHERRKYRQVHARQPS